MLKLQTEQIDIQKLKVQLLKHKRSFESLIGFMRIHFNIHTATCDWAEMEIGMEMV